MEKTVTLRFYDVTRTSAQRPALADLLTLISNMPIGERQRYVTDDDILIRLEDFVDEGDFLSGQFIRGQTGNRPGMMTDAGTQNLPFTEPIGITVTVRNYGDSALNYPYQLAHACRA